MSGAATPGSEARPGPGVAVVGAGLAGLIAARALAAEGREVVVFEKSRGLGGRLATRRVDGHVLDHGCPVIEVPARGALDGAAAGLGVEDLRRLPAAAPGRVQLVLSGGQTGLPKALAEGLDIRREVRVGELRPVADGLEVVDEEGASHGTVAAAIVTAPAPQAAELLAASGEPERAAVVGRVPYDPAVCVLTEVAREPHGAELVLEGPPPLAAVSLEWRKRGADGPRTVVARLDASASRALLDATDEDVLRVALPALDAMLGAREPEWTQVKRWRYALPAGRLDPDLVRVDGSRIVLAGDAFAGADLEAVMASGERAAALAAELLA